MISMKPILAQTSEKESIPALMQAMGRQAKAAYRLLAKADATVKNAALMQAAAVMEARMSEMLRANAEDMAYGQGKGLSGAMLDRLRLDAPRIVAMAEGLRAIATLPDPVGRELERITRPSGITIRKVSVPLGVIGIIYESRPNVTADAGGLCIKSGNAVILRGGSESIHSAGAIVACLHDGLRSVGLPEACVQLVQTRDRAAVTEMLGLTDFIDVIIPRGGKSLTARVAEESRIPTILHLDGNCHSYIHASADREKMLRVVRNAKLRRTGVCGATESLLIDKAVVDVMLPALLDALPEVEMRGDARAMASDIRFIAAVEADWSTEYLDAVLSVRVVEGVEEAVAHINYYGSHHTDCIIAEDMAAVEVFLNEVDSAIVMHNSSTQFADGGEFGMGAEIGISTGRLHARGPVGCAELTTYKYVVSSDGAVRG
jgi:glutamate-5-semialdehyde dehydrogenase